MTAVWVVLGYFCLALKTVMTISRHKELFVEFEQTTTLRFIIWLYPLAFLLASLPTPLRGPFVGAAGWIALVAPPMVIARKNKQRFEHAGTDRVDEIEKTLTLVFFGGVVGAVLLGWKTLGHALMAP